MKSSSQLPDKVSIFLVDTIVCQMHTNILDVFTSSVIFNSGKSTKKKQGHIKKLFCFPSPCLMWWWVSRPGKKRENEQENEYLKGSGFQRRPGCQVRKTGYKVNLKAWSFHLLSLIFSMKRCSLTWLSNVKTAFKQVVLMLM